MKNLSAMMLLLLMLLPLKDVNARVPAKLTVDKVQVNEWNLFTRRLYELHLSQLNGRDVVRKTSIGGYQNQEEFYQEERFYDAASNALLSRIQWESEHPDNIHMIEVFVYDSNGELRLDYLSAYLPQARNAPIQTLINIHHKDKHLSAYRQFDASGDRIYEQCKGGFFGQGFFMSLDEDDIPFGEPAFEEQLYNEVYPSCFGDLVTEIGELKNPINAKYYTQTAGISAESTKPNDKPQTAPEFVEIGIDKFNQHEFEQSILYLSKALELEPENNDALFWRGMAYGRNQQVSLGVADLSLYIEKNPNESRAYTKRGVRYIWMGELKKAKADLLKALQLDAGNSEAHDDLGVIYAQEKSYNKAIWHFQHALKHDPSYQKAWHNLAMVHYVTHRNEKALEYADKSLLLKSNKDSLLLKSLILDAMGNSELAHKLKSDAEKMTGNNWSETFAIQ